MDDLVVGIEALGAYMEAHTTPPTPLLAQLDRDTHVRMLAPRMLSGPYQGRFLSMISCMIQPRRVLEIGAFTGYGTLSLAEGLTPDGLLYTIEHDPLTESLLQNAIAQSPYAAQIKVLWGEAEAQLEKLAEAVRASAEPVAVDPAVDTAEVSADAAVGTRPVASAEAQVAAPAAPFDLIFLDADKVRYADYYPTLKKLLRSGGWLLADNILWNGKVCDEKYHDKDTLALRRFNDLVQADEEVENVPLLLRDGLMMIRKK